MKKEKCNESNIFPSNYFVSLGNCYTFAPAIEPHAQKQWPKSQTFSISQMSRNKFSCFLSWREKAHEVTKCEGKVPSSIG